MAKMAFLVSAPLAPRARCSVVSRRVTRGVTVAQMGGEGPKGPSIGGIAVFPEKLDLGFLGICGGSLSLGTVWLFLPPRVAGMTSWFETFRFDAPTFAIGSALTVPLFAMALSLYKVEWKPIQEVTALTQEVTSTLLGDKSLLELVLFGASAGIGEELLFRNVFMVSLEAASGSEILALAVSSLLFGLSHFASPMYAILSGLGGLYLGLEFLLCSKNVLGPVLTHSFYDLAFAIYVVRTMRS